MTYFTFGQLTSLPARQKEKNLVKPLYINHLKIPGWVINYHFHFHSLFVCLKLAYLVFSLIIYFINLLCSTLDPTIKDDLRATQVMKI